MIYDNMYIIITCVSFQLLDNNRSDSCVANLWPLRFLAIKIFANYQQRICVWIRSLLRHRTCDVRSTLPNIDNEYVQTRMNYILYRRYVIRINIIFYIDINVIIILLYYFIDLDRSVRSGTNDSSYSVTVSLQHG